MSELPTDNEHVQFDVLGSLRVRDAERDIEIARPKERSVLAALLVEANSVVPLDRLVNQIWGDEPPSRAVGTLHAYISNLRRLLEPGRLARARATVLISRPPGYTIVAGPDDLDAARFERLANEGRAAMTAGTATEALAAFDEALSLWRGPAYAEFVYDDFTAAARRRLEELRLVVVEDRADAMLTLSRHDEAVVELEAQLVEDPLRERMWQQLVVALYRSGRQADALNAVRRARTALDEIGLEPAAALRELEQAVLNQSPALNLPTRPATVQARQPIEPDRTPRTLVGRDTELEVVDGALRDVCHGSGRLLLVTGEAGIGKSALAAETGARAQSLGAVSAVGRCPESGGAPPLWPWIPIVRQLVGGELPGDLLPLLDSVREGPTPLHASLIHAITSLVRTRAVQSPVVIVVEDVQWADDASLRLLQLALDDLVDVPVLVVLTLRTPADAAPALDVMLVSARRRAGATEVALGPLSSDATAQLVARECGDAVPADLASVVHARTSGNPFYVVELSRLLIAERRLSPEEIGSAVPSGIRDVVRRRLQRLPEQANTVIAVAAVVGSEVDVQRVSAVTELDEDAIIDLFELAAVAGVLAERADRTGVYRFAHDIVRETILESLPGVRRARLHQRVLEATLALQGESRPTAHELAKHAAGAVPVTGPLPAVERLLTSARVAVGDLAITLAERQVRTAESLLDQLPPSRERDRLEVQVHSRLGQLLVHSTGDLAEAARHQKHALRLCPDDDIDLRCGVLLGTGCYAPLAGDFAGGVAAGKQLLALVDETDLAWQAAAHYAISMGVWSGDSSAALAHIDKAVEAAAHVSLYDSWTGIPEPTIRAQRALILAVRNDDAWRHDITSAVEEATREHHDWALCWTGAFGVIGAFAAHDPISCLEIADASATAVNNLAYTAPVLEAGLAWAKDGDDGIIREAAAKLARMHDGMFRGPVLTMLAANLASRGDRSGADAATAEAEQVVRSVGALGWLPVMARVPERTS